jgi:hypothetical protein
MNRDRRTWFSFMAAFAAPLVVLGVAIVWRWRRRP